MRRIVVGIVATRSEAQIYEQMLRAAGVPAFSELGSVLSEFADVAPSAIYVNESDLNEEAAKAILAVLGNNADREALQPYLNDVRTEPGAIPVAWFETYDLAKQAQSKLKEEGIGTQMRELPWEVSPFEGRTFGLYIDSNNLDLRTASIIWSLVGDRADTNSLSPYRRFQAEG